MKEKQVPITTQQYTPICHIYTKLLSRQQDRVHNGTCIIMQSRLKNILLVSIMNEQ